MVRKSIRRQRWYAPVVGRLRRALPALCVVAILAAAVSLVWSHCGASTFHLWHIAAAFVGAFAAACVLFICVMGRALAGIHELLQEMLG